MATTILLNSDELTKNTILGGNLDPDKYLPCVKNCQKTLIKPLLGQDLYDKICLDFKNDDLSGLYLELYEDYLKDMVINGSAELYLSVGAYNITNAGITKIKNEQVETVDYREVDQLVKFARRLYQTYERDLLKWLKENPLEEYTKTCGSKYVNIGGWILKRRKTT